MKHVRELWRRNRDEQSVSEWAEGVVRNRRVQTREATAPGAGHERERQGVPWLAGGLPDPIPARLAGSVCPQDCVMAFLWTTPPSPSHIISCFTHKYLFRINSLLFKNTVLFCFLKDSLIYFKHTHSFAVLCHYQYVTESGRANTNGKCYDSRLIWKIKSSLWPPPPQS